MPPTNHGDPPERGLQPGHLQISNVQTTHGAQSFAGINNGYIHFAGTEDPHRAARDKVKACRDALFLTDTIVDRETLKSSKGNRTPGTCEWIRGNKIYQSWLRGDVPCLWISGGPGKGKTMLSIFLTEDLEKQTEETEDAELIFYFCTHQDEKRNSAAAILRGLVYQLLKKRQAVPESILSYFESPEKTKMALSSEETLWIVLQTLAQAPDLGTVFCILDGLDECDDAKLLVDKFVSLFSPQMLLQPTRTTRLKLAIVSRHIHGMDAFPHVQLDPDNDTHVNSDIRQFISASVRDLPKIPGFDDNFRSMVEDTLLRRAQGTFLWVGFVMIELSKKTTCTEITETLRGLPQGLPAMYSRMLLQTDRRRRSTIGRILQWVTLAIRPLTIEELAAAIDVSATAHISSDRAICDQVSLCGPILKIQGRQVSLIHQSARDYLLRETVDNNPVLEELRIKQDEAHFVLASACLDHIEGSDFCNESLDICDPTVLRKSPLAKYAVLHWPSHTAHSSVYGERNLDVSRPFFQRESLWRNWWTTYVDGLGYSSFVSPFMPLLHIACYLGVLPLARKLLRVRFWIFKRRKLANKNNRDYKSPLFYAAREGHEAVVRLLLARGASVKKHGGEALVIAATRGHIMSVHLLLDRGVDIKEYGAEALFGAAFQGHKAVVRLLLNLGAGVDGYDGTALVAAATGGYELVVQLLIDQGADLQEYAPSISPKTTIGRLNRLTWNVFHNAGKKKLAGRHALVNAAQGGHETVVQLLLDRGVDVEEHGGEALLRAVWFGHKTAVQLLLDRGANVKKYGGEALVDAARRGHETIVQLLLDCGVDVETYGSEALSCALREGQGRVVQLLESAGALRSEGEPSPTLEPFS